jgi:DNA-directed RNA polymerase subunit RPC12/RpoP
MDLQNYTCPKCGGSIQFEPGIQKVICGYCRSEFDAEVFRPKDVILDQEPEPASSGWKYAGTQWLQGEQEGMVVYSCRSCGADIVAEETQGTATCLFCRKPVVITAKFSGTLRPDMIIPFKFRKEDAVKALENHYLKKRLLPKAFKDKNHINEIKGIYVPFWLFDAKAEAQIAYNTEKIRTWSDVKFDYQETSRYRVTRAGDLLFSSVPVDGSSAMDDALMDSIEPYNMGESIDFQGVYLTGYFASKYDIDMETCFNRADKRITESTLSAFMQTVTGYNSVSLASQNIDLVNRNTRYGLLPIWLLTTVWKDQTFVFAMNGQTGKLAGDLPLDKAAKRRWFWGIFLGVGAIVTALVALSWSIQGVLL